MAEILEKPCAFTRGLGTPWKEELTGTLDLLGILEEGEFYKAWDIIGTLQWATFVEPSSFDKEVVKVPEGSPKKSTIDPSAKVSEASKDSNKRVRGFLSVKSYAMKALEQA